MHKGQNGKVGVVGGSKEYTGAPYYVGAASLKAGADISHIFCTEGASIPIKSYSPELIVHGCLTDKKELTDWIDRCTSIVIGPGLGREESLSGILIDYIDELSNKDLPLVGDADFLWYLSNSESKAELFK